MVSYECQLTILIGSQENNAKGIERNLLQEARRAQMLMIWTDCDREGEHIGSEVASVCTRANPTIRIRRARFSAIIAKWVQSCVDWQRKRHH